MSEPEFSLDWPHGWRTRDGRKARILCTDARLKDLDSIVAIISDPGGDVLRAFRSDGRWVGVTSDTDLINAPAPKREFVVWVNVYPNYPTGKAWESKKEADDYACPGRLARKRVVVTEGEFDEEPAR